MTRGARPEVGDPIVIVDEYRTRRHPDAHDDGVVTRVGRKLFDVEIYGRSYVRTFRIETWNENEEVGYATTAYTPEEYDELPERQEAVRRLASFRGWSSLSTAALRRIVAALDEEDLDA